MASLIPGIDRSAIVAIAEHHMRYDLAGYPRRLPPRPQHLTSRIVAVADAYDAMTSRRAYSAARVQDEAVALLAKIAGASLDPALVRLFIRLIGVYPPRSVVRLTSDEVAIVLANNPLDPSSPQVRVISSASGAIIEPRDVDLCAVDNVRVAACLDPRTLNVQVEDYL
jgi:HD-GYP domain-containing protein (c-di-GMP phosphodiesterase class II)